MSQHLDNLQIGEYIDVRGPNGLLVYNGRGMTADRRSDEKVSCLSVAAVWRITFNTDSLHINVFQTIFLRNQNLTG